LIDILTQEFSKDMFWYFDRRTLKKINWQLLQTEIRSKLIAKINITKPYIEVHPVDSQRTINIQFADCIAYALFKYYEFKDNRFIKVIKSNIKKTTVLKI